MDGFSVLVNYTCIRMHYLSGIVVVDLGNNFLYVDLQIGLVHDIHRIAELVSLVDHHPIKYSIYIAE